MKNYNIRQVPIPAYYARRNPIESVNGTLKTMIARFVDNNNHSTWDEHLYELRYKINTTTQSNTRVSLALFNDGRHPEPVKSLHKELEDKANIIPIS